MKGLSQYVCTVTTSTVIYPNN